MLSFDPLASLKAHAFKLAAGFFLITALVLGWLVLDTRGDLKVARKERDAAQVELGQCRAETDQWRTAHKDWQAATNDLKLIKKRKDAELKEARRLSANRIRTLETAAANLKAYQPKGEAMCERMSDVDREFVSQLRGVK